MTDYTITVTDHGDVAAVADGGQAELVVTLGDGGTSGGLPAGGTNQQYLVKFGDEDFAAAWATFPTVPHSLSDLRDISVEGATNGQILALDTVGHDDPTWIAIDPTAGSGAVDSVNGKTGVVVLVPSDIGAQPSDADLTAIAALATASFGRSLLTQADAATARATLGAGTSSLAIGTTGTTAAAGNDSRLSDSRTPTPHAASHSSGGGDAVTIAESQVTGLVTDLAAKAPLASPAFTGNPTAPTPSPGDADTSIATTAFVAAAITAGGGYTDENARDALGAALVGGTNVTVVVNDAGDTITINGPALTSYAPLASPALTGNPTAPTASSGDNDTSIATTAFVQDALAKQAEYITIALSDETTAITTGTAKVTWRAPFALTLTAVRASLTTASSAGTPTVDINESGTTILSTKLTIDASEKTSVTAATAAVISDASIADDAELTFDIDTAGTGAAGLKVTLYFVRA